MTYEQCMLTGMAARRPIMMPPMRMLGSKWKSGCRMQVRLSEAGAFENECVHRQAVDWLHFVSADSSTCGTSRVAHVICVSLQCCRSSL